MLPKNAAQNVLTDITFKISRRPTIYDLYTLHNKAKTVTHSLYVTVEETHAHLTFVYQDLDSREQAQLQMNKPRPDLVFILKGTLIFKVILIFEFILIFEVIFIFEVGFIFEVSFIFEVVFNFRSSSFFRSYSLLRSSSIFKSSSF